MTAIDRQLIQQEVGKALACLARALKQEAAGSSQWLLLVDALEALETIEVVADGARDAFTPSFPPSSPAPDVRAQRFSLTRSLLGYR
jgi:hypothetical protein